MLLFTLLIFGFFFIIKVQLTHNYFEQLSKQTLDRMHLVVEDLTEDIDHLYRVDISLDQNIDLILSRYAISDGNRILAFRELQKYASTTQLIDSIILQYGQMDKVLSTKQVLKYTDGIYSFTMSNGETVTFDPAPYFDADEEQLICLKGQEAPCLLYFPQDSDKPNYFFYILDTTEIQQQFKSLISNELLSLALVAPDKTIVTGVNQELIASCEDRFELKTGIYELDDNTSLCVNMGLTSGFSLVSLISNDFLYEQVNTTFLRSYTALLILFIAGFLAVFVCTNITYKPLKLLVKKVVSKPEPNKNYLEQLDDAFRKADEQQRRLQKNLDKYRLSIKKSLLDSLVGTDKLAEIGNIPNIDQFFNMEEDNEIFVVLLRHSKDTTDPNHIKTHFQEAFPEQESLIVLETTADHVILLFNYTGGMPHKKELLKELLLNLYEEQGYWSAISNGTFSPMDIPFLYENALVASSYWPGHPVADYTELSARMPSANATLKYPNELLNQLSMRLMELDFSAAREVVHELFRTIDGSSNADTNILVFYTRCILVDILTIIINSMNQMNLKFNSYNDLFYETLFLCRNSDYKENKIMIASNMEQLIDFFEQASSERIIATSAQIKRFIEDSYCNPEFSITLMATHFQVSVTYMSYLVKKELNANFSDYLWNMRLEEAKKLLTETDTPIDEVSTKVGYLSSSSFRRKFKQETGLSPSQFRAEN